MNEVIFKTIKEIAEWLRNNTEKVLDITNDIKENIESGAEPSGWCGLKRTKVFDGNSIVFGYYGTGIIDADCENEIDTTEDIICRFLDWEFANMPKTYTEDSLICVDKNDWEEGNV